MCIRDRYQRRVHGDKKKIPSDLEISKQLPSSLFFSMMTRRKLSTDTLSCTESVISKFSERIDYSPGFEDAFISPLESPTAGEILARGKKIAKPRSKRNNYNKITNQVRDKFVHLVESRRLNMRQAALFLGINYSTAKSIMNVYRQEYRTRRKNKCRKTTIVKTKARAAAPDEVIFMDGEETHESVECLDDEFKPKQKLIDYDLSSIGGDLTPYTEELRLGFTFEEIERLLTIESFDRCF
eukprot:TRINITY_DN327_c0_g1_i2.p1 TRINITY_DN327_c0_g1~~TRINITY_DN327_c0_g1_i2.p1  ORF type:complete len:266 (+),score=72.34 TRINITY_DN327_c0_g1_i2:79-798(+)